MPYRLYIRLMPLLLMVSILLCGCQPNTIEPNATQDIDISLSPDPSSSIESAINKPLSIHNNIYIFETGSAIYPVISGAPTTPEINKSILQTVKNYTDKYSYMINGMHFYVPYNDHGVLSLMFLIKANDGTEMCLAMNYDVWTGETLTIDKLFSAKGEQWRTYLAREVTQYAEKSKIVLLSPIRDIENDRMFVLTQYSLVLVYNLYEITTYSYGIPQVSVTYDKLARFLETESIITRIAL